MVRTIGVLVGLAVIALTARSHAEPSGAPPVGPLTIDGTPGQRLAVDTPHRMYVTPDVAPAAQVSSTIYLNRCTGGCQISPGNNDARTNTSSIPTSVSMLTEFENVDGATGTTADAEWGQIVQCVTEVYSPYAVTVTDQRPADGSSYHEAIVAGNPQELAGLSGSVSGQVKSILGVAPLSSDCAAIDNVISFTFADNHGKADRVNNICWTASQESAHAFGLDHEYSFSDGASACNDPMTYRTDCGGEKFFRNESANCGETTNRACKCGGTQNSHLKILQVFGQGSPITGNPTLTMLDPAASGGVLGAGVALQAGAKRGVARVELYLNGYKWTQVDGARFGLAGQPDPSGYNIPVPKEVPDSIVDVKTIAYDDLGSSTESPVVTVTRGAACTSAASCATGQKCEAGKCFWDPPSGEVGDDCTYAQFCKSGLCTGTADRQICTQSCIPGVSDSCPSGLDCIMQTANAGVCFDGSTGGGCCAVDRGGGAWWAHAGVAALVLGLVTRRRRRR